MQAKTYARLAEEYLRHLRRQEFLHYAGLSGTLDTEWIYAEFSSLFTRGEVLDRLAHRDDREGLYLAQFAVEGFVSSRLRPYAEEVANLENSDEVTCGTERLPFRAAWSQMLRENDHARRCALSEAVRERIADTNPLRLTQIEVRQEAVQELGFADYRECYQELHGQSLQALAAQMKRLLKDTDRKYRELVERSLDKAGVDLDQATGTDLRWVLMQREPDGTLAREQLIPAADAYLEALGICLRRQTNIHLDLEWRPRKHQGPACFPIAVPDEIWTVAEPEGGLADFLPFFHELGHLEHLGHVRSDLSPAFRMMGDTAGAEAFAFLMQSVVPEPEWMRTILGIEEVPPELTELAQALDLWCVRRCAAQINYELELYRGDASMEDMPAYYASLFGEALSVRVTPERYLLGLDQSFYCSTYVRAYMFEACLREYLQEQFGPTWFLSPKAGRWLRAQWATGTESTVEELSQELGFELCEEKLRSRLLAQPVPAEPS